jgi:hypothetical protein
VSPEDLEGPDLLLSSQQVMGNGVFDSLHDVVYVKPEVFETRYTRTIADQLEAMNTTLLSQGRHYLLIGFGRWGSSDPFLGIPVNWGQISSARVIVETTLPNLTADPSQGTHFFHNITSFGVSYFSVSHFATPGIDWEWLASRPVASETDFVRHVRLQEPLLVRVDGRSGRGAIWRRASDGVRPGAGDP